MKKGITILLTIVYLVSFTGVTMHLHYCMGEQAGWGLGKSVPETCARCGMEKSKKSDNGCCKDEYKFIKITTDQKTTEPFLKLIHVELAAFPFYQETSLVQAISITHKKQLSLAPLRSSGTAVYITNCVFRI